MARTYGKAQDLIDFTRSSGGTALRRVKYGAELVDTANTASAWSPYGNNTVVQDGDAVKATYVDSASGAYIYLIPSQGTSESLQIGTLYTLTASAKVNTGSVSVEVYDGTTPNQVAVTSTSYVDIQINFIANGLNPYIRLANMGSGEIIWIKNISVKEVTFDTSDGDLVLFNHPNNIPRIEYDADGNLLGLLVEESRTNLVTYSEDASQWSVIGAPTITTNIATAPDGTQTVDGIQDVSGDSFERIKAFNSTVTANSTVTGSVFIKKETSETNYGGLTLAFTGGSGQAYYGIIDAVNGTIVNPSSGLTASFTVTDVGDFWRFSITATDSGSNTQLEFSVYGTLSSSGTTIGTGIGSIRRFWGAQVEMASFPTSYIPTSGSTATRSADVASLSTSGFGYNSSEGSVSVEFNASKWIGQPSNGLYYRVVEFGGNFGSNADGVFRDASNNYIRYRFNEDDGITSAIGAANLNPVSVDGNKVAFGLKGGDNYIVMDGSTSGSGTGTAATNIYDVLLFGRSEAGTNFLNGHIKSIKYYPRRLTNTQLQELTS